MSPRPRGVRPGRGSARCAAGASRAAGIVLALLLHPSAYASMEVTTPFPLGGTGATRGVVQLRCSTDVPNVAHLSRGAVLDVGIEGANLDLVLTTAHGLPESEDAVLRECLVLGAQGRPYRIDKLWRAPRGGEVGVATDWAVVRVEKRLEGDVGRLAVGRVTGPRLARLATDGAPLRLLLRQAELSEGDCRFIEPRPPYDAPATDLIVYTCRHGLGGVPGLSGSPLLIGVGQRPLVFGIHIGWGLQMLDDGRLHVISIGRPIDGDIAAAIAAAAAEARR